MRGRSNNRRLLVDESIANYFKFISFFSSQHKKVKMTVQNQVLTFKEKKTLQTRKAEVEQIRAKVKI